MTKIEWTEETWNPLAGCSVISTGCKHCYAMKMAARLEAMEFGRGETKGKYTGLTKRVKGKAVWSGTIRTDRKALQLPYSWKKPRTIFVNSMSDLFHEKVPLSYIKEVFQVMNDNKQHTFQVLTKRADILLKHSTELTWTNNIWAGVSVENKSTMHRIDDLIQIKAYIKFLSLEPLLEDLGAIDLLNIDWVIVGGESGANPRRIYPDWVRSIRDQCRKQGVSFFFKQWGGKNKKRAGRELDGNLYDEMPTATKRLL